VAAEPLIVTVVDRAAEAPPPLRLWWLAVVVLSLAGWAGAIFLVAFAVELLH